MRRLRILLLTHEGQIPPDSLDGLSDEDAASFRTEFDVVQGLRGLGHEVHPLAVQDDLAPIRAAIREFEPHIAFNLLLEFHGVGVYEAHVISWLELLKVPYTGSNPRGLLLARDKGLSKKILAFHRIPVPRFGVFRKGRRLRMPKRLEFPLIVKSAVEEASLGISQASIVHDEEKLRERVAFVHDRIGSDAIAEEYIAGRELTIGVLGNERLQTFPIWEMDFGSLPEGNEPIATARIKWNLAYQDEIGLRTDRARGLDPALEERIARLAKRAYRALDLSGFARMDLRLSEEGKVYLLEANPNPDLRALEDFASGAQAAGLSYPELLQRILGLGLRYRAAWKDA